MVLVGHTTLKIFVGGLAWETQTETLKHYFEQFGDIHEAVVITDRASGKSKGYGFVTFKDLESARRACENPYPVINGRRANCNLAYIGTHKRRPPLLQHGMEKIKAAVTCMAPSMIGFGQPQVPQYALSSTYGYPTFSYNFNHSMNYYNAYYVGQGQQQLRFPGAGVYINYYPFPSYLYTQPQQQQSSPNQHPKMGHFPYFPQHFPSLPVTAGNSKENAAAGLKECSQSRGLPLNDT